MAARPTSVAVLLPVAGGFVAIRSAKHGGRASAPGGLIDRGETPQRAAAREVAEETGLAVTELFPLLVRRAGRHVCAAFTGYAVGTLRGSREGDAFVATRAELLAGAYPAWARAALRAYDAMTRPRRTR